MNMHDLIELKLPNVNVEEVLQNTSKRPDILNFKCLGAGLPEGMHKFIETVAVKHPEWRLEAVHSNLHIDVDNAATRTEPRSFRVSDSKTVIGYLSSEYSYGRGKNMYVVRGERYSHTPNKVVKTSDLKKAIKNADKIIRPTTDVEKFDDLMGKTKQLLSSANMSTGRHVQSYLNLNRKEMIEFIRNNVEAFVKTYADDEYARKSVEKFLILCDEEEILESLEEEENKDNVIKVVQEGDTYYMRNAEQEFFAHKLEDLSEDIKYKLGILKLVEVRQAVKSIGFRGLFNSFILTS